ncbi:cytochrome c biogenesis protein CCS1, chloroplastic [Selaginella moellendorffii]|nr:cytochrome c biogenesis protein CCS1, chloroplastic [Selaginella moellendorffii]|eukprot:XP_002977026.2 cytochrome c biogenesis protein CCS1, chloroplastic [Selaginella moellendorffii]
MEAALVIGSSAHCSCVIHSLSSSAQIVQRRVVANRLRTVRFALNGGARGNKSTNSRPSVSSAPPLTSEISQNSKKMAVESSSLWRKLLKKVLVSLSSFKLAIAELVLIAALSSIGTVIDQGGVPEFYFKAYPEDHPFLGIFSWKVILALNFDHIYTAPYFLGLLALLAASLVACTSTRQVPLVKVARRWSFMKNPAGILKMDAAETLPDASLGELGVLLSGNGYEVFSEGSCLYAFKGLAGRLAPIGVHAALLLIMGGGLVSALGGYHGSVTIPEGLDLRLGDGLNPNGILATPSPTMDLNIHVNKFYIEQYPNGQVKQFFSDLSITDAKEGELLRKTISVNNPLRIAGATIYQTDWGISTVLVRIDDSEPFNLAMAPLRKGDNKLFGTLIPEGVLNSKGISILARDLESVVVYDKKGEFVGVRRVGSQKPIEVDGVNLVVDDMIGSTGLEVKMDPAVPVVYAGFGALMFTTCISYLSHSQIWALQKGSSIIVGGKSNRAKLSFEQELTGILDSVPEHVPNSAAK